VELASSVLDIWPAISARSSKHHGTEPLGMMRNTVRYRTFQPSTKGMRHAKHAEAFAGPGSLNEGVRLAQSRDGQAEDLHLNN